MAGLGCCGRLLDTNDAVYGMRVEPKVYLANERTFLNWLQTSVTLGSIASVRGRGVRANGKRPPCTVAIGRHMPPPALLSHTRSARARARHANTHYTTRSPCHGRS